ncbi:hypothetical protein ABT352_22190 [Streptosporangium sp. NPDC000563]|uniref:hypothetical protein n=1 Tax=unclassified Streptosporangium TaxID=2632669 RepID=UPI0033214597
MSVSPLISTEDLMGTQIDTRISPLGVDDDVKGGIEGERATAEALMEPLTPEEPTEHLLHARVGDEEDNVTLR